MGILSRILIAAFFLLAGTGRAAEQQPLIEVQAKVDTSVITIGDQITYSIIINRAKDLRIIRPGEGLNLGSFEIKGYHFPKPVERDGRIIERFDFTISVYDTGRFVIPPYPLAYFPQDSSKKYQIIEAPSIEIHVKSVVSGEGAKTLKDIKAPIDIPFNYKFWLSVLIILILIAAAAFIGYRMWKKRQQQGYLIKPPAPPRPAHEVAMEDLQALFNSDLLDKGQVKEFFIRLSDIMRLYLEGRYFIRALEETTTEIMRDVRRHLSDEEQTELLHNILTLSDLVKFAKYRPAKDEIAAVKEQSVAFVQATRLVYEAPDETGQESIVEEKNTA